MHQFDTVIVVILRSEENSKYKKQELKQNIVMISRFSNHHQYHPPGRRRQHHDNVIIELFRFISNEIILFRLLIVWNIIAVIGIIVLSFRLSSLHHHMNDNNSNTFIQVPDSYIMGYTTEQLYNNFYNVIGIEGCTIYTTLALWDIYILTPAYTLFLGTIYVYITRQTYDKIPQFDFIGSNNHHHNTSNGYWNADQRAYLVLLIAIFDIIETILQKRGCTLLLQQHHTLSSSTTQAPIILSSTYRLSNLQVRIASIAVSMKWSLLALFFLSIVERLYHCYKSSNSTTNKSKLYERQLPLWM
jgi:hypothetical protein